MTWQYYYDDGEGETIYYHDGTEVARLDGRNGVWKNGIPFGKHLDGIRDAFQSAGTPDRIAMTYDLHMGFEELDEPF